MSGIFAEARTRWTEAGLLLVATIFYALTLALLELSQGNSLDGQFMSQFLGFIGVFGVAHLALCLLASRSDQVLLPVVAVLNAIGMVMLARLDISDGTGFASRQVIWTALGAVLFVAVLALLPDHRALTRYSYILGALGLILLALPLVWPQPTEADARIWLRLGPFSIQPGEFSKILLIIFFAMLLTNKRTLFTVSGYSVLGLKLPRLRDLAPILMVWGIAIVIMGISNDFGPALLLFTTVLGMLFMATGRVSWLLIGLMLVAAGAVGIYQVSSKIQERVAIFQDPLADFYNLGNQLSLALFGMSSGGLTGTGLGRGYPGLVPVVHSDYILAAIGEEFGLIGLAGVLTLFAIFVSRGFATALRTRDTFGKLVSAGLALTLAIQVFVVTAGISAMMPMTGLTTPFMSAGGSSLMANFILLALMLRISHSARRGRGDTEQQPEGASEPNAAAVTA